MRHTTSFAFSRQMFVDKIVRTTFDMVNDVKSRKRGLNENDLQCVGTENSFQTKSDNRLRK
jgi:hypothetical protein